jgi:hypothetical protein
MRSPGIPTGIPCWKAIPGGYSIGGPSSSIGVSAPSAFELRTGGVPEFVAAPLRAARLLPKFKGPPADRVLDVVHADRLLKRAGGDRQIRAWPG